MTTTTIAAAPTTIARGSLQQHPQDFFLISQNTIRHIRGQTKDGETLGAILFSNLEKKQRFHQ
jgi:hypothetical protein